MMKLKTMWRTAMVLGFALMPSMALAALDNPFNTAGTYVNNVGENANIGATKTLPEIIGSLINVALGFLGILLLVYLLYAGFTWMTAGGDETKVKTARTMISQAVIGLIIIVAAFSISTFVLGSLVNATK